MPKHLQQLEIAEMNASRKAASVLRTVLLKANIALVLVLVLVIIPTSGVALIA